MKTFAPSPRRMWLFVIGVGLIGFLLWRIPFTRGAIEWTLAIVHWPWQRSAILLEEKGELLFTSKEELARRNEELEEQVRAVALSAAAWQEAARTLPELQALLEYKQTQSNTLRTARVLFFTEEGEDRWITVDQGKNSGIREGQVVMAQSGFFVGIIQEVFSFTSRVRLISSPHLTIGIMPVGSHQAIAVAHGDRLNQIVAEYIPRTIPLDRSTFFVTSGTDTGIPAGLLVGRVDQIHDNSAIPYVQATLSSLTDLRRLNWVGILE